MSDLIQEKEKVNLEVVVAEGKQHITDLEAQAVSDAESRMKEKEVLEKKLATLRTVDLEAVCTASIAEYKELNLDNECVAPIKWALRSVNSRLRPYFSAMR